ncbi:putative antireceptor [Streptococcus pneumoniae]|nr:putative antireceptor [Streptococcus pneumoniae]CIU96053.1 putative antireceptor [Streptococcus pneumoniae]COL51858.1 putative antireceptor [Streptococcus pneumoniae]COO40896.1 putative antireceptor [Streptococcus pneumoniae]COR99712.1 putative antireceptor [Streptococcus pneumoniae]
MYKWTLIKGADGTGISNVTNYYLATTVSTGITRTSAGWTTTPQPITSDKRYLWNYRVELYTNGTSKTTEPTVIGVHGEKGERGLQGLQGLQGARGEQGIPGPRGADGRTQYTHMAYADNATGGGFSQTNTDKAFVGVYIDFNPTDSRNPADYRWTRWKGRDGANGVAGRAGADGRTSYFHIAYAASADGSREFSLEDNRQQYMGYYSDFTAADSRDRTKYKWFDRLANVQVGSQNLLRNTATLPIKNGLDGTWRSASGGNGVAEPVTLDKYPVPGILKGVRVKNNTNGGNKDLSQIINLVIGQRYTISCWARVSSTSDRSTVNLLVRSWTVNDTNRILFKAISNKTWVKYSLSFTADAEKNSIQFGQNGPGNIEICGMKLELGNVATDWSLSVEDIQSQLDGKADQKLTQQQLTALTEKAQLHDAELKAKATMEQLSDLEKAYNAFVKSNADSRKKSESDLVEAGRRIDLLTTQFGGLAELKTFIDTYMKSTNEGLIIGKNDASSTIKVSSDRISMFSAGKEVMYISQGVINIDNGIFTASIQIGRFRTEQYHLNKDVNVIRYIGG